MHGLEKIGFFVCLIIYGWLFVPKKKMDGCLDCFVSV